jgi:hypothetical protein
MTSAFESAFAKRFRHYIGEEAKRVEEIVLAGKVVGDVGYRQHLGELKGLRKALEFADLVEKELSTPDDRKSKHGLLKTEDYVSA